jgi:hypothetical protein
MFGERRQRKEEAAAERLAAEQAAEAVGASETDDTSIDPDERLEREEEPLRDHRGRTDAADAGSA